MPYSPCATSGSLYYFSEASTKCSKCVRCSVRYDGNFSADDFDRLHAKQGKLKRARQDALEWVTKDAVMTASLSHHIEALRKAKGKMIERESRSLAELDLEEERQA
jgi:hypothetical protein